MSEQIRPDPRPGELYSVRLDDYRWATCRVIAVDECWVTLRSTGEPSGMLPAGVEMQPHILLWRHWPGFDVLPVPSLSAPLYGRDAPPPYPDTPTP